MKFLAYGYHDVGRCPGVNTSAIAAEFGGRIHHGDHVRLRQRCIRIWCRTDRLRRWSKTAREVDIFGVGSFRSRRCGRFRAIFEAGREIRPALQISSGINIGSHGGTLNFQIDYNPLFSVDCAPRRAGTVGYFLLRRVAMRAEDDGATFPPMESKSATNWLQSNPLGAFCVAFSRASWLTTV